MVSQLDKWLDELAAFGRLLGDAFAFMRISFKERPFFTACLCVGAFAIGWWAGGL